MTFSRLASGVTSLALAALVSGCGVQTRQSATPAVLPGFHGLVHGGQQPVGYSTIQLYTVGTTGDGSPSAPLLTQTVQSDANGNFTLTNLYQCTTATYVYLTATQGNPLPGQANPNLAMMAALGPCTSLTPDTFITINEVTTVATVAALYPYMSSYSAVGSGTGDAAALAAAFSTAEQLVNSTTGTAPGIGLPTGASAPAAQINTLANILAACINTTGGSYPDTTTLCGQLFTLTKPTSGSAATDTIGALLNLEKNPTLNTAQLFAMGSATGPFQPTMAVAPPDFGIRITPNVSSLALQVGPTSLTFPATAVGTTSAAQLVVLRNFGSTPITLTGLAFTGTNASDFAETTTCGSSLAFGDICNVMITVTPSATGTRNAYLSVTSSSPDSPQYVTLTATGGSGGGTGGIAQLSTNALTFLLMGTTQDVTLTNGGSGTLSYYGTSDAYGNPISSTCPSSMASGASCVISIPSLSTMAVVSTSDPSHSGLITITTANVAGLPVNLVFPDTVVANYAYNNFSLTTASYFSNLGLPTPALAGANAGDFALTNNGFQCFQDFACTFGLSFAPTATGLRTAKLVMASSGEYLPLSGNGIASASSTQTTLSTASTTFHLADPVAITLSNLASTSDAITSINVSGGFTQTNTCGTSLEAQSACQITVMPVVDANPPGSEGLLTVVDSHGTYTSLLIDNGYLLNTVTPLRIGQTETINASASAGLAMYTVIDVTASGGGFAGYTECVLNNGTSQCPYSYTFSPLITGLNYGSLVITGTEPTTPDSMLQGTGFAASGAGLYIQNPTQGLSAGANTVRVLNVGSTTLTLTTSVSGANASDFAVTGSCGATLSSGSNCSYQVTFTPSGLGLRTASLVFTDTTSGSTWTAPLSGSEADGSLAVSPTSYAFPTTAARVLSDPVNFTVTTGGNHAVSAALTAGYPSQFTLTKSTCALGESPCVLTMIFNPSASGPWSVTMTVTDLQTSKTANVTVTGQAGLGIASFSPNPLTFVSRAVGSPSAALPITMSNIGSATITGVSASLSGTNASEFSLTNGCSAVAPYGGSPTTCTIGVVFSPTSAGSKSATVTVTGSGSTNLPATVSITGSAY